MKIKIIIILCLMSNLVYSQLMLEIQKGNYGKDGKRHGKFIIDDERHWYPVDSIVRYKHGVLNGKCHISTHAYIEKSKFVNGKRHGKSIWVDYDSGIKFRIKYDQGIPLDTHKLRLMPVLFDRKVYFIRVGFGPKLWSGNCAVLIRRKYGLTDSSIRRFSTARKNTMKRIYKHNLKVNKYLSRRNGEKWREEFQGELKNCIPPGWLLL
ncbi:MAG: hypothetical protein JKY33_07060 [Bacteroidia bacterium]|nr:hypothetical protein [Bacteroidia bacterium]